MKQTVLITGANRGIGLALVEAYLKDNWNVIACCRNPLVASNLEELNEQFDALNIYELDVTNYENVTELAQQLNGTMIHLLINNAGYYGPKGVAFGNTDVDEWRKVLEINTIAPMKITEAFYANVKSAKGTIANMSSAMGSMGENTSGGAYIYRSSKSALNAITKSIAMDGKDDGVKAVALHPGWVQTDMGGPNASIGTAESANGLKTLLDNLNDEKNGGFYDCKGRNLAW
ncbi:SDR family oxidoreductase [Shewanella sp. 202IG2-18]|uniref:SDR family oxidoreductase n=1 Tax=Parashewanella hymeniacidonis TaxID=2807618 RepID=UPI00195FA08F|nr:SDR family oxidoreductase [Parashewanella hymeniacidonis]MBM7073868.1 SDR family oxidoreductase [Parashewanella hymeniacidonis]